MFLDGSGYLLSVSCLLFQSSTHNRKILVNKKWFKTSANFSRPSPIMLIIHIYIYMYIHIQTVYCKQYLHIPISKSRLVSSIYFGHFFLPGLLHCQCFQLYSHEPVPRCIQDTCLINYCNGLACWFRAFSGLGFLGYTQESQSLSFSGILGIQTTNLNQQLIIS